MFATLDRGRIHPEVAEQRSSGETSKIISDAASVLVAWAQDLSYRISDDFLLLDCAETFRDTRYSTLPWARRPCPDTQASTGRRSPALCVNTLRLVLRFVGTCPR